jgi:hypothetical protein
MIKTKYILIIVLLSLSIHLYASNEPNKLFVCVNGSVFTFQLSEKPIITFDTKKVYISTSDFSTSYENVDSLYFNIVTEPTNVEKITNTVKTKYDFKFVDGQTIIISGVSTTVRLDVYSINGIRMKTGTERSDDNVVINLSSLPRGFYIVKADTQSFKIFKR